MTMKGFPFRGRLLKLLVTLLLIALPALLPETAVVHGQAPGGSGPGGRPGGGSGPGARATDHRELPETIAVATEEHRTLTTTVAGRLRPVVSVPHTATVNGVVTAIHVRIGETVAPDSPLYTIERDETLGSFAPVIVRARVAGVVSELPVRLFNEVRGGDPGAVVIDPRRLSLETFITDKDIDRVEPGMVVEARTARGEVLPGRLVARSPEADYRTGLYRLFFEFAPPDAGQTRAGQSGAGQTTAGQSGAGQFVTVDLPVVSLSGVFVAQDLPVRRYGQYYLWVVTDRNTLRLQQVTPGMVVEDEVRITSGLTPGMRYLRETTGREREGMTAPGLDEPETDQES
jgi:multidrug efflux pump subunit AcrA (membrane-fusion protein)